MRLDSRTAAVLLLALSTACGSTVQMSGHTTGLPAAGAATDSAGGLQPAPGAAGPAAGSAPGTTVDSGPTAGPARVGTTQPAQPGSPVSGTSAPAARTSGFGFTATELRIGVAYDSTYSQELGSAGVSAGSQSVGDQKRQVEALVADLNSHGGVAGRKVVPVFYDTKGSSSQNDPSSVAQAACSFWTQDNQVWAAMTYVVQMDNESLYKCLSSKHVVFVPLAGESTAAFARYSPYLWSPAGVTPEQVAPVWAARLKALGYFAGWDTLRARATTAKPVIGLLYGNGVRNNQPELDTSFRQSVKKALASYGLSVATEAQVTNSQADESSAVLRFQNAHVTHVIGDYSVVNFAQVAESQQYRPRYALSSFSGGIAFKLFAPPQQLHGAVGIGWVPSGDVESDQDPGTSGEAQCRRVMQASGQSTTVRLAWFAMTWACDTFAFFAKVVPQTGLDARLLPSAAAHAGRLSGAFTFAMSFPGGIAHGASVARDFAYDDGCSCFRYTSTRNYAL